MAKSKGGKGGAIVNVSSGSAYIGIAGRELYTVSKGALNSLAIGLTASMTPDGACVWLGLRRRESEQWREE